MTRSEIRELILQTTGRSDKVDLINSAINLALEEVSSQFLWSDLLDEDQITLTQGALSVPFDVDAARIVEIRAIDDTTGYSLRIRPKTWLVKRWPNRESRAEGKPVWGWIENKALHTLPLPDKTYDIHYSYYKLHAPLSSDSDEVIIKVAASAVVAFATSWVFRSIELHENAVQWKQEYRDRLASAMRVDRDNSVVVQRADQRGESYGLHSEYWLDPFVKEMP